MTRIVLVRHAQASFGTDDYDRLSPLGHQQAAWLAEYFKSHDLSFDRAIRGFAAGAVVGKHVDNHKVGQRSGELVGRATSGGYGWRLGKSLALAMVKPEHGDVGTKLQIKLLGDLYDATVIEESPFDPENERLRA